MTVHNPAANSITAHAPISRQAIRYILYRPL
jgi:hypothetical protein